VALLDGRTEVCCVAKSLQIAGSGVVIDFPCVDLVDGVAALGGMMLKQYPPIDQLLADFPPVGTMIVVLLGTGVVQL